MNSMDIITNFQNRFGYVEDYESIIEYLEQLNMPLQEINNILHQILEWNNNKINELVNDINKTSTPISLEEKTPTIKEEQKKQEETININYYKKLIEECDDPDFITEILPSSTDSSFEEIIYTLLLSFYKELVVANQIKSTANDQEEKLYIQEEIDKLKERINIIKAFHKEETEQKEDYYQENIKDIKIIYLQGTDTPYFITDIANIGIFDIPNIESIIKDLKQGKILHEKKFTNHEDLKGISAIRKADVRIIFTRLDNKIIILGALAKRFQNPNIYRELLKRRNKLFKNQKDELKEKIKNNDYIKENEKITKQILSKNSKKKDKKRD